MIRYYFTFDGKNSTDFETYIATGNLFDAPERDIDTVEIPGKNGTITLDNGRYKNFSAELTCYIRRDMQKNIAGLRAYLGSKIGYFRFDDNLHPDEFRIARFVSMEVDESDHVGASLKVEFDFKPQRFLKAGEIPVTFAGNGSIYNPTLYASKPLIRAYGTGTFTINGVTVQITAANQYTDIDCELMDAFKGATNCNGNIVLTNGEFPTIAPGLNAISKTGITTLEITPRWWRL